MKVSVDSHRLAMLEAAEAAWRRLVWVLIECGICSLNWPKPAGYSKFTYEKKVEAFVTYLAANWEAVYRMIRELPPAKLAEVEKKIGVKVCNISGSRPAPVKRVKAGAA